MKKSIKRISLLLALLMIFTVCSTVLVGCGAPEETETTTNAPSDKPNTPEAPTSSTYTVTVKSAGGMKLSGISVNVCSNQTGLPVISFPVSTNESGVATFTLPTSNDYHVILGAVPAGYAYLDKYSFSGTECNITLTSSVIKPTDGNYVTPAEGAYKLGSVMHDFKYKDTDGKTYVLSEVLQKKKAVLLNFWYVTCSACVSEFPLLNNAYNEYVSDIEVLALNNHYYYYNDINDTEEGIKEFKKNQKLDLPMILDTTDLMYAFDYSKFDMVGYPVSVMIDRYGVVCMIEVGAIVADNGFNNLFKHFTADNYQQILVNSAEDLSPQQKPDVSMPSSEEIAAIFNESGMNIHYYPEQSAALAEYSWPFVITEKDGEQCLMPSNSGTNNSYAFLHADVELKANDVLAFEYFSSTEKGVDILSTRINGEDIYQISGISEMDDGNESGWKTCYTYVAKEAGTYTLTFWYVKDTTECVGEDAVYLKNLRIVDIDDIDDPTHIIRDAATHPTSDGSEYQNYADIFYNEADGYYHVDHVNGPLLLAKLLTPSLFNDGEMSINDYAINNKLYWDYMPATDKDADAELFYAEAVNGGYRFFRDHEGKREYLELYHYTALDQPGIRYVTPQESVGDTEQTYVGCVFSYDAASASWVATVDNVKYYLGVSRELTIANAYRVTTRTSAIAAQYFPVSLFDMDGAVVTTPVADTAYMLGFDNTNYENRMYLNGEIRDLDTVLTNYLVHASNATINGYCTVNEELRQLLMKLPELESIAGLNNTDTVDNRWLQICRYYNAYGTNGVEMEDPILGLSYHSAFVAIEDDPNTEEVEKNQIYYDGRVIMPRGLFYKFVPTVSGVYNIVSYLNPNGDAMADAFLFFEDGSMYTYEPLERLWMDMKNCSMYAYMEAGTAYYINIAFSDIYGSGYIPFSITCVGETYELFRYCSAGYFTSADEETIDEYSLITGGLMKIVYDEENDCYYEYYGDDKNNRSPRPIYVDFSMIAPLFSHNINFLVRAGAFDFAKTEDDEIVLEYMRVNPENYEEKLKALWGDEYDQEFVDEVVNGIYHGEAMIDYSKTEKDVTILEYIKSYPTNYEAKLREAFGDEYDQAYVDDVVNGIYHGSINDYAKGQTTASVDYTAIMEAYINSDAVIDDPDSPMYGCMIVNAEIAEILQHLVDKFSFSGVENAWSKLCCYWQQYGPDYAPAG